MRVGLDEENNTGKTNFHTLSTVEFMCFLKGIRVTAHMKLTVFKIPASCLLVCLLGVFCLHACLVLKEDKQGHLMDALNQSWRWL